MTRQDIDPLFADLDQEIPAGKPSKNERRYDCPHCFGTGKYQGARVHQQKGHCFACRGKGYFKTDPRKLAERRNTKRRKANEQLAAGIADFKEQQPEMFKELESAHFHQDSNNGFITSLADQLFKRGALSDKQIAAYHRGKAKYNAIVAEREAERAARAVEVDLSAIEAMFVAALQSGYKKPMYRALDLRIKPGKGGSLYVLTELRTQYGQFGEQPAYEGKIDGGQFHPVRDTADDTAAKLKAIAADPRGEAVRHGQRTGRCSCCGRELTKHASIEAGIGPVCAAKWGL